VAATGLRCDLNRARVARSDGPAVLQIRADDILVRVHLVGHGQGVAISLGQKKVSVGMRAATEVEVRAGKEGEVRIRENAELEHRNTDGLDGALQLHFSS